MTLKLIPVEHGCKDAGPQACGKQKSFNPGGRISKKNKDNSLKNICMRLVHFINRGSKFTYQQVDDLIINLQHSVLNLQKKKQEIMRNQKDDRRKKRHQGK